MKTQKTKKSFKKKALLSSLSMLLVATVAVGSATFAWFSTNNQSTAQGINVKTQKQSNLLVATNEGNYSTLVNYGITNKILLPASTANGTSWFKAEASEYNKYGADQTTVNAVQSGEVNNYYYKDGLHIQNDGSTKVTGITVTLTFTDDAEKTPASDYARVALVRANEKPASTAHASDTTFNVFAPNVSDTAEAVTSAYNAGASTSPKFGTTTITASGTHTLSVPDLDAGAEAHYFLYVWFEGQDQDCKDGNAGQQIPNLKMVVTGTPEEAKP